MKHYSEITEDERIQMELDWVVNWCWGKGSFIKPPYKIFFKASCNIHDLSYVIWGDEERRKECDLWFLGAMCRDAEKTKFSRYYKARALLYFFAVRIFWKKYFNYNHYYDKQ